MLFQVVRCQLGTMQLDQDTVSTDLHVHVCMYVCTHIQAERALDSMFEKHSHTDIIESVDSISRDERGFPLMQYITNGGISRARYTITHFKHHHRVLRLISNRMSV